MENRHEQATVSFPAWKQHLEQVAESHLQDALQHFLVITHGIFGFGPEALTR
jgi:hypothetical protein